MWTLKRKYAFYRKAALFMLVIFVFELFFPTAALALTGGPSQPEFSSFEPVATTNMVNEFSGDFTYNLPLLEIPGANGGGYPLSLSYHSGASPEEEASWVGYGWTLNPGAINRAKRGFPDDYKGQTVKYWNKVPANQTTSVTGSLEIEAWSFKPPIGLSASLRYNNYKGFSLAFGAGMILAKGTTTLGFNASDGQRSYSVKVNPAAALSKRSKEGSDSDAKSFDNKGLKDDWKGMSKGDRIEKLKEKAGPKGKKGTGAGTFELLGSSYGIFSNGSAIRASKVTKYRGGSVNFGTGLLVAITPLQVGPTMDLTGNFTFQQNVNSAGQLNASDDMDVYGYMYAAEIVKSSDMMDYYTEKLNAYDKQDNYLGIPFSNPDNFAISGEGIGGGFRMYNKKAGHYRPNSVTSHIIIANVGFEAEAFMNFGGGGYGGTGFQRLSVGPWSSLSSFADSAYGDEPVFFRFNNDPGGKVDFGSDYQQQAAINQGGSIPGFMSYSPSITGITTTMNGGSRSSRSSYIAYHTNREMGRQVNSKSYKSYALDPDINANITRTTVSDGLGEFAIFNEDGSRHVYGLPVYSRNEKNMQYDLEGVSGNDIDSNYLAFRDISDIGDLSSKVGEESDEAYATTFLLTEITSPDYIDRTWNGPSDDDFGGYTRFSYNRVHGHDNKTDVNPWYRWRIPYTGLLYNRGELSTVKDDMGSVMCGEKEIYYLDTVETKTHFAVFMTSDRLDGFSAADNNTAANNRSADGSATLQKLNRIELYSKNSGVPEMIKSVRFEYDYSLSDNLPNGQSDTTGKLTLTKVWFEYDGIYNAKISPYIFEYEYPSTVYPSKYSDLDNYGGTKNENPNYSFFTLDPWGNHQRNGGERHNSLKTWVNQDPDIEFDPAAWQLKVIKLPTEGEIHIQYEQDDYSFVQDKPAHAMVSLKPEPYSDDNNGDNIYYLNTDEINVLTATEQDDLVAKINSMYYNSAKKIYFKFLYALIGTGPNLSKCNSEYITGYCNVKYAARDGDGVYIKLGSNKYSGRHDLPRKVCIDYTKSERLGNLNKSGNCNADAVGVGTGESTKEIVNSLGNYLFTKIVPGNGELCTEVAFSLSYLRIPLTKAKKGGGVRVKRLLMYDEGMESGDKALYGSEYSYTMPHPDNKNLIISSGVAPNEPASIREENALVEFDKKLKQKFLNKVVAGRDKEQAEKPLGESILPAPSVGYEIVTIRNIHSGITNTGFAVKQFYTAREYPMQEEHTEIETEKDFLPIPGGVINYFVSNLWMSQGFTFKVNSMHGQPKRDATYAGDPDDIANARLSTLQEFTYFQPGEKIPVMGSLNSITLDDMGKETEVVFESRSTRDVSNDLSIEYDVDVGVFIFPLFQGSVFPSYTRTVSKLSTHVTTKVVRYPAIQKRVKTYADGIYHISENLAFNRQTGQPVLTRTTDGYHDLDLEQSTSHDGAYMTYDFPASSEYKNMGQKARNERFIVQSDASTVEIKKFIDGTKHYLVFTPATGYGICDVVNKLYPGDLIKLYDKTAPSTDDYGVYHVSDSIVNDTLYLWPTKAFGTNTDGHNDYVIMEVLRSGRTNQLSTSAGSFTSYGDTTTFSNISSAEMAAREAFAILFDNAFHNNAAISASEISPLLSYINPATGSCDNMQDSLDESFAFAFRFGTLTVKDTAGQPIAQCHFDESGHFALDPETKGLVYFDPGNSCFGTPMCIDFCPSPITTTNVVQAEVQTYNDDWSYDFAVYDTIGGTNYYERGTRGKWRLESNYVFLDTIKGANDGTERNYNNAGTFPLQLFDWADESANDTLYWIKLNTVTSYSPNGNALEEQDVLDIYSSAKFGYDKTVPYLVAKNADYGSVQFDGFEKTYESDTELEDGWTPPGITLADMHVSEYAHSGTSSIRLKSNVVVEKILPIKPFTVTQQMLDEGVSMKIWVRDAATVAVPESINVQYNGTGGTITPVFHEVAMTGEWALYEAVSTNFDTKYAVGDIITANIVNGYSLMSTHDIWIDDYRLQPLDAQMVTYVYDTETLRLIASFDDQHFGLYYVYNAEGKLVRKLIETTKGIKTITETQYHTPTVQR